MRYIAVADIHFREDRPICRSEEDNTEWLATFERKMVDVATIAEANKVAGILFAGDLVHSWRNNSDWFKVWMIRQLNRWGAVCPIFSIPGNHDSMGGKLEELDRTPYRILSEAGVIWDILTRPMDDIAGYPYTKTDRLDSKAEIVLAHKLLWHTEEPYPGAPMTGNIKHFVKNCLNPQCRLLVSGDNHKPFTTKVGDVTVVNCGSLTRQEASQADYEPAVWLIDITGDAVEVTPCFIPTDSVILRDHIDNKQERLEMLDGAVAEIDGNFEVTLNFKDNYKNLIKDHTNAKELAIKFEECNK